MKIHVAGLSHPGNVRTTNEDHFCIGPAVSQKTSLYLDLDTATPDFPKKGLLVAVADGMGGYAGGELASRVFLETFTKAFYAKPLPKLNRLDAGDFVRVCLKTACDAVVSRLSKKRELEEGGTTVAGMALFAPDIAVIFHIGDSRVLRVSGRFLRPLTVDHTLVGAEVHAGEISEAEAMIDPEMRALTRSIGLLGTNDPEVNPEHFWVPGDRFIICTDGLHGVGRSLSANDLREAAQFEQDPAGLVSRLVETALDRGGHDNITGIVLQVH